MSSQQQPRPWFRLASIMRPTAPPATPAPQPRPPAPTTVLQPPPPRPPFRPPVVAVPQPTTQPQQPPPPPPPPVASPPSPPPPPSQATAPATPVQVPTRLNLPAVSRSSVPSSPAPRSPATRSPVITSPANRPPAEPSQSQTVNKPESPTITSTPTRPNAIPFSSLPPSPKPNAASAAAASLPSSQLPSSPATRTLIPSQSAQRTPPPPTSPPAPNPSPYITSTNHAANSPKSSPFRPKPEASSPKKIEQWDQKTAADQSPIRKPLSRPPSPLILPTAAQLKPDDSDNYLEPIPAVAQQKTVLTQNTINERSPKISTSTSHKPGNFQITNKQGGAAGGEGLERRKETTTMLSKKSTSNNSKDDQYGIRIITLAGENRGAVMELNRGSRSSRNKTVGNAGDEEGKNGFRKMHSQHPPPEAPVNALVNSNVQEINNSILYNCAYTNRNPGVHLSVSRSGNAGHATRDQHRLLKDSAIHD